MSSLWRELRPTLWTLAGLSLGMNLFFLVPSLYMLQVFDRVLPSNSPETLVVLLVGAGIGLLILFILDALRSRLQQVLGNLIEERLAPRAVELIVNAMSRNQYGVRSDGLKDVNALRAAFSANGLVALMDAPWAPAYVLVIWLFHPWLGAGAALACVIMLTLAWLNDRVNRKAVESLQKQARQASGYVESSLRNAEILQALGMTSRLLQRWRTAQSRAATAQSDYGRRSVAFSAGSRLLRQWVQIGMLSLGAYLVLTQRASPGVMIATTVLLSRAIQPIEQVVGNWHALAEARAAYGRMAELVRSERAAEEQMALGRPDGRLRVESVFFRHKGSENAILSGVSFALESGQALAVIGPSGAGKSTLARLLTGIWTPSSGTVRLDGADMSQWSRESLGPWIGYVPQDVELFEGTVAENVARLGPVQAAEVVVAAKRANAHEMILGLPHGYDTVMGEGGIRLSPGQRQRIALARALYGDPRLVILDEPNSNLDAEGEDALARAMRALRTDGVTSVLITHRPSLIAHVDRILTLGAGRVQQFGPPQEVLRTLQQQAQAAVDRVARTV